MKETQSIFFYLSQTLFVQSSVFGFHPPTNAAFGAVRVNIIFRTMNH